MPTSAECMRHSAYVRSFRSCAIIGSGSAAEQSNIRLHRQRDRDIELVIPAARSRDSCWSMNGWSCAGQVCFTAAMASATCSRHCCDYFQENERQITHALTNKHMPEGPR